MKILIFNNEEFEAEKIIKTESSIIGQDSKGKTIFEFRGISDFTMFTLKDDRIFDAQEQTIEETQNRLIETRASMENVNADFQNFMQYALDKLPN